MKVYTFFLIKSQNNKLLDVPQFYAYTDDKNLRNNFICNRQMSLFHEEIMDVSESEFKKFEKDKSNYRLVMATYITKNDSDYIYRGHISIASTYLEELLTYMQSDKMFNYISRNTFNIGSIKKKYAKALCDILFNDLYLFNHQNIINGDYTPSRLKMDYANIHVDSFSIFMDLYGHTMKLETKKDVL